MTLDQSFRDTLKREFCVLRTANMDDLAVASAVLRHGVNVARAAVLFYAPFESQIGHKSRENGSDDCIDLTVT